MAVFRSGGTMPVYISFNAVRFDETRFSFTCQCKKRKQKGLMVSDFALFFKCSPGHRHL